MLILNSSNPNEIPFVGIKVQMSGEHIIIGQDICIILYGNIYNWRSFSLDTTSTPEDIIRKLYITYGMEYTLQILDGVFSIVLLDQRAELEISTLYITCDPLGLIPIYFMKYNSKYFMYYNRTNTNNMEVSPSILLEPGTFTTFTLSHKVISEWEKTIQNTTYSLLGKSGNFPISCLRDINNVFPSPPLTIQTNTLYRRLLHSIIQKYIDFGKHIICIIEPNNEESYLIADFIEHIYAFDGNSRVIIETYCIVCDGDNKNNYENTRYNHTNLYIHGNISDQMKMKYLASCISENVITEDTIVFMGEGINFLKGDDENDFILREKVKNIHKKLVPNVIEPFNNENVKVVFPLLDKSFVDFYLSIPR